MGLATGTRLGPYEIVAPLGAGGMGEVYRARDLKLGREVAIKILPDRFADDAERVARFEREAKALASLNHPHIAQIYGFEQSGPIFALVMELVEGEDLSQRLARGAISLAEALPLAKQIAEALEAAHEQGIVHRDLKPANIKVRDDGTLKVLDFGLAKALDPASGADLDPMASPTISAAATEAGVILGTAAYMSPEQAKGQPVDKRADLWGFGVVLYEMLTGRRAFLGDGTSDSIARVLLEEPDWSALPAGTPGPIGALLRRCLEKDRRRRLDSAAAARFAIEDALAAPAAGTTAVGAPPPTRFAPWAITATAAGAVIAVVAWTMTRPPPPAPAKPSRYSIVVPPSETLNLNPSSRSLALSPDGGHLVYLTGGSRIGGSPMLARRIGELGVRPLAGVDVALGPFFSPDSQWVGFFASPAGIVGMLLMKVPITGGPPITVCAIKGNPLGGSWGDDGTIVFGTDDPGTGLWRVSASGGEPTVLTTPDPMQRENDHVFPSMLPGGRGVLLTITREGPDPSHVAVLDLTTGQRKTLLRGGSDAAYVEAGYLIYAAANTLRAVPFDPVRFEMLSDPVPVIDPVVTSPAGAANYAVSRQGTLVYAPDVVGQQVSLVWVDRRGREEPIKAPLRDYGTPRLSPDGTRVVVQLTERGNEDLWLWDLVQERLTRLTVDPARDVMPVWTLDSRRVIFASNPSGDTTLFSVAADGTGTVEPLTTRETCCGHMAMSMTPDGTRIVGFGSGRGTQQDIILFSLTNPTAKELLLQTRFNEVFPEISPNGRYIGCSIWTGRKRLPRCLSIRPERPSPRARPRRCSTPSTPVCFPPANTTCRLIVSVF